MSEQQQPPPPPLTPEQLFELSKRKADMARRDAEREHDRNSDFLTRAGDHAVKAGENALRSAILINGGAATVVLTFIGTLVTQGKLTTQQLQAAAGTLMWFAAGVALGGLGSGMAYLVNYYIGSLFGSMIRYWEHPYVKDGPATWRYRWAIRFFQSAALLAGCGALFVFVMGMWRIRTVIGGLEVN